MDRPTACPTFRRKSEAVWFLESACHTSSGRCGTKAGELHTTPAPGGAAFGPDGQADGLSHLQARLWQHQI
jgi:hypothetical protein